MSDGETINRGSDLGEIKKTKPLELGDNYLLVIGIDEYQDKRLPKLNNAVLDAKKVKTLLVSKYQFSTDKAHLRELYDKEATQSKIIDNLRSLAKALKSKDSLIVYFAGHGEYDEVIDVGYWIPHDARKNEIGSYLSFDALTRWIRAIKTRHTFILTDSCHSGSFFNNNRSTGAEEKLERMASRWLLTAGRNEPVPDGRPGDNSPFAKSVLYHLQENTDARLPVSSFCSQVRLSVANNTDVLPEFGSIKGVGDMGGEFMFRLKEYKDTAFEEVPVSSPKQPESINRSTETTRSIEVEEEVVEKPLLSIEDVHEKAENYIAERDFEAAFDFLREIINSSSKRRNDILMQQSQYNGNKKQVERGLIDASFSQLTQNRIAYAMSSIVKEIKEKDLKEGVLQTSTPPTATDAGNALEEAEKQQLEEQAALITEKLNHLRKSRITAYDPNQQFALDEDIAKLEKQLAEIKERL
jgi:hypothetical protein